MPRDNIDLGIDKAGPKVHDTGPYDEDKGGPEGTRECEGCGGHYFGGYDVGDWGWWCRFCLDERLKVE